MPPRASIESIQRSLGAQKLDGWLFFGFRGSDPIALRILGLEGRPHGTRRWLYLIPARGEPRGLVHAIEPGMLDSLPGEKTRYASWRLLEDGLAKLLEGARRLAMQYAPRNHLPTISRVDAGTVELVRSLGAEVVSSADLVQEFEARLTAEQLEGHLRSARALRSLVDEVFSLVARDVRARRPVTERSLQEFALRRFEEQGLTSDHGPILAVNAHAADPHFDVPQEGSAPVREGDLLLFDVWAKEKQPDSVHADITWCGFVGKKPPGEMARVFDAVRAARDAAIARVTDAFSHGDEIAGFEVDRVTRAKVDAAGFGEFFPHRTGHSLHQEVHGNGANLDDLETHDTRKLIPGTLFTIEPGIYLPGRFGVRSEVNVYHAGDRAEVTGPPHQEALVPILERF